MANPDMTQQDTLLLIGKQEVRELVNDADMEWSSDNNNSDRPDLCVPLCI